MKKEDLQQKEDNEVKIDCRKVACMDVPFFDLILLLIMISFNNLTGLRVFSRSVLNIFFEEN